MLSNRGLSTLILSFLLVFSLSILNPALSQTCTDADGDGWGVNGDASCSGTGVDCDDTDPTVYPGAQKICDGKDNNCDGKRDYSTDIDFDQDGVPVCGGDCDDTNPDEYPGNIEGPYLDPTCVDTHDNDCDGPADENDSDCQIDCTDNDMDGYGTGTECFGPDCNDNDPLINPGILTDECDGKDNDCDVAVDEDHSNTPTTCGVGECAGNTGQLECQGGGVVDTCDPLAGAVAEDTPGSGLCIDTLDNDCDGEIDNPLGSCYVDTPDRDDDGDGYCDDPTTCSDGSTPGDCDDVDPTVYPGAADAICNGIDNNCDGTADDEYQTTPTTCGVGECAGNTGAIECQGGSEVDTCDPLAGAVAEDTPGSGLCIDTLDNDCDGEIDNPTGSCLDTSNATDDDGDGWCEVGPCLPPANPGFVGDCDDTDPTVYPGAQKICDGKDNNCDGKRDYSTDIDFDQDGVPVCGGDCDDTNPDEYPGNIEGPYLDPTCVDTHDNDCDGPADENDSDCQIDCTDNDMDGYGTGTECFGPDCNDNDPLINPGILTDECDGKDNDCDVAVDEDHSNTPTTCGVGECAGNTGQLECQGGGVVDTCDPLAGAVAEDTPGSGLCIDTLDNDCDGEIDNPTGSCYVDTPDRDDDGDGYCDDPTTCSDGSTPGDCDDVDPTVYPGAADAICNGIDNNCDGTDDDEYQTTPTTCGVGECAGNTGAIECQGGSEVDTCDPLAGAVAEDTPGSGLCIDTLDNDCDGEIDNPLGSCLDTSNATDNDGDGWCEVGPCLPPANPGFVGDCDDTDPTVYPGAQKICDGKDNNCDGKRDYSTDIDFDQDGVPVCGGDCDDTNPDEYPGNIEGPYLDPTCVDTHDNDCDGPADENDSDCQIDCTDNDMDGYGTGTECFGPDCNDNDPLINPGILTDECDGKDNDCDVAVDEDHSNTPTTCGVGECAGNTGQLECQGGGVVDTCDPLAGAVAEDTPGSGLCIDTLDNDCDGEIDNPTGSCYVDTPDRDDDGDGYCDDPTTCSDGSTPGDCDDVDPTVYPGAADAICNGIDNNCDGTADDEYQTTPTTCGVGECAGNTGAIECQGGSEVDTCDPLAGSVAEDTPGSPICIDTLDNDCDGEIDNPTGSCLDTSLQEDNDGDGWCEVGPCLPPANPGFEGDCDDTDDTVYPGAQKICDGLDNNCDGKRDFTTDVDFDQDGVPVCAGDCDDNDPLAYPGNTPEGPFGDPTCSDIRDNDCVEGADAVDPKCAPPSCGTDTSPRTGPHSETMRDPGPDGIPNTGDDIDHPENSDLICGKCHDNNNLQDPIRDDCFRCHTAGGQSKLDYPDPWPFGFGSAPDVMVHSSTVVGTKYGAWDMDCVTCHNPHVQEQDVVYGTTYGKLIKDYICFDNSAIGGGIFEEIVEFTAPTGPGSFADGPPVDEKKNICNMCHTQTNHHRRDDAPTAPGGQDHNNGQECTTCHPHLDGFAPTGGEPAAPHNTGRFLTECDLCHVTPTDFSATIPDSKCEQCHTPSGIEKTNFPLAPDVLTHADFNGSGKYVYNNACVDCHNPMFDQPNLKLIRPVIQNSVLGGTITFTSFSGVGSFADGSPYINNICNTCHSQTNHHQADGTAPGGQDHNNSLDCGTCHTHDNAFLPGAAGQSHDTHLNSIKGPQLSCDTGCHGTNSPPLFADGNDLANTAVCDNCHSPGGSFDGVNDPVTGAKANWADGVYDGISLAVGKEMWCAGCHDDAPSNSMIDGTGVSARNVIGDGTTYGFYVTGHGNDPSVSCLHCHSPSREHIDHEYRSFETVMDYIPNPTHYRFYDQKGMELPYDQDRLDSDFALCYSCHDSSWLRERTGDPEIWQTNFRQTDTSDPLNERNLHYYHVYFSITPKKTCVFCHDPHGTENPRMTVASRMGTFKNLRFDVATGKYFELTDSGLWNTIENRGGAITTPPGCSACHGSTVADLTSGADPNDQYKAGWYLRTYNPKSYMVMFDIDNDGITDDIDNCPTTGNAGQTDTDADGIGDSCDNCPGFSNLDQADSDMDNLGDICDMCPDDFNNDIDNDGLCADADPCPADPGNPDADNDLICDDTDNCPDDPNSDQADIDEDGVGDVCDPSCVINGAIEKWVDQFGSYVTDTEIGYDYAIGVATDINDNAFLVGFTTGEIPGQTYQGLSDAYIAKYDSNGNQLWLREFGTTNNDSANSLTTDSSGNAYVTGNTGADLYIAKYDVNGNQQWLKQYGITGRTLHGNGIVIDNSNNLFVIGTSSTGPSNNNDIVFLKTSSDGTQQWLNQISSPGIFDDTGSGIAIDNNDNVYVTGHTRGVLDGSNMGTADIYIAKYDNDGNELWLKQFGSTEFERSGDIAVDINGNIYVTGYTYGILAGTHAGNTTTDLFLARYDTEGNQEWIQQINGSGDSFDYGYGVSTDPFGNAYITGYMWETVGGYNIIIAKYDTFGNQEWLSSHGTLTNNDHANDIAVDSNGYAYVAAEPGGDFGAPNMGSLDMAIFKSAVYCP